MTLYDYSVFYCFIVLMLMHLILTYWFYKYGQTEDTAKNRLVSVLNVVSFSLLLYVLYVTFPY